MATAMGSEAEIERLRAEVARLAAERDTATAALARVTSAKEKLERKVTRLEAQLDELSRRIFGRSSERIDPLQLGLFLEPVAETAGIADLPPHVDEAPDGEARPKEPPSSKRRSGPRPFPKNLRRERIDYHPSPEELQCACGGEKKSIGSPETTERLDFKPASLLVVEHVRHRYRCTSCHGDTTIAPLPPAPGAVEKDGVRGRAEAGLLAHVVTAKYCDHLPLNRLQSVLAREGVYLHRSTLCDWVADTARLLWPVAEAVRNEVLTRPVVGIDETSVLVVFDKRDPEHGTRKARLWVYRGQVGEVFYMVSETKEAKDPNGPFHVLRGYRGSVQADAAGNHNELFRDGTRVEVGCNAHARRKFFDARETNPTEAAYVLAAYKKVYEIEARVRGKPPDERRAARQAASLPIFTALDAWLDELAASPALVQGSALAKAVNYTRNQRRALRRFLDDGRLEPDNNAVERALRIVAVGRKNWLFAGSPQGADDAATLYTLVGSCKDLGVDPWTYLQDVIKRRAADLSTPAAALTPAAWAASRPSLDVPPG